MPFPRHTAPVPSPADDGLSTSEARKTGKGKAVDRPSQDTDAATGGTPPDGPDDPRRDLPPRLPDQETQRKQAAQVRKVLELARRAGWRDYGGVYGEILGIEDESLRQHLIEATKRIPVNDDIEKEKALRELEPLGTEQGVNNYHRSQLPVPELPADLGLDGLVDREAYAEWYRREGYDRHMHLLREGPAGPHGYRIGPGESYLWSQLKREPRGERDLRSNGLDGSSRRVFRYDRSKSEFEVYDHNKKHLGALDAVTGQWKKGKQVTGRREKHTYDDIESGGKMVV